MALAPPSASQANEAQSTEVKEPHGCQYPAASDRGSAAPAGWVLMVGRVPPRARAELGDGPGAVFGHCLVSDQGVRSRAVAFNGSGRFRLAQSVMKTHRYSASVD